VHKKKEKRKKNIAVFRIRAPDSTYHSLEFDAEGADLLNETH
jgi:hypothetical protein